MYLSIIILIYIYIYIGRSNRSLSDCYWDRPTAVATPKGSISTDSDMSVLLKKRVLTPLESIKMTIAGRCCYCSLECSCKGPCMYI